MVLGGLLVTVSPSPSCRMRLWRDGSSLVVKACVPLCDAMHCSPPSSSLLGSLQARMWVPYLWVTREALTGHIKSSYSISWPQLLCQEVCNFLGSVSPQQRFEMADRCYSPVTAQFYLASKGYYTLEVWGQAHPRGGAPVVLASSFYAFVSPLPWACPIQIGLAEKGVCFFTWSSHSCPQISFCSIFAGFSLSLSFSHHHLGLLFPILTA